MLVSPERVAAGEHIASPPPVNKYDDVQAVGPQLAAWAVEARKSGINHRGFLVGGVGLAYSEQTGLYAVLFGANNSPYEGAPKRCAEVQIMQKAEATNFSVLRGIVVAATDNRADIAGVMEGRETPTLPPCRKLCQPMLRQHMEDSGASPRVDAHMPVLTVGGEERKRPTAYELRTVGGLLLEHGAEVDIPPTAYNVTFYDPGEEHWFRDCPPENENN